MRMLLPLIALSVAACTTTQAADPPAQAVSGGDQENLQGWAHLGESINFDIGPDLHPIIVEPVELLSDSRCPSDVECIWAGELRMIARIDQGGPTPQTREFVLGGGGAVEESQWYGLTLVNAEPYAASNIRIALDSYRFHFALAPETIIIGPHERISKR